MAFLLLLPVGGNASTLETISAPGPTGPGDDKTVDVPELNERDGTSCNDSENQSTSTHVKEPPGQIHTQRFADINSFVKKLHSERNIVPPISGQQNEQNEYWSKLKQVSTGIVPRYEVVYCKRLDEAQYWYALKLKVLLVLILSLVFTGFSS